MYRSPVRFFGIILALIVVVSGIYAQNTGTGGNHSIQGRIFLPNGQSIDTLATVRLESTSFGTISVLTDRGGGFIFNSLAPGNYTVVVDLGENFEISRESVSIEPDVQLSSPASPNDFGGIRSSSTQIIKLPIYLQFKRNARQINKVINAKLADVPKDALKHYQKAIELSQQNKIEDSVAEHKNAISIYPQFSIALSELGKQYLKLGKLDDAITSLRASIKIEPNDFEAKLNYGIALLNKKEVKDAEKELIEAIAINSTAVTPHLYLGMAFIQNQNLDQAQTELELAKSLKGKNEFPLVHKYLGGVYWAKKQYKSAADELETYLQLLPNIADANKIREIIKDLRTKQ